MHMVTSSVRSGRASTSRSLIAIEAKLSSVIHGHDVRHLNWLESNLGTSLLDRIVISTGTRTYRRHDGIAVVPLALLGP